MRRFSTSFPDRWSVLNERRSFLASRQALATATLHGTMDEHGCELLLAPSGGPAWPIEPKVTLLGALFESPEDLDNDRRGS